MVQNLNSNLEFYFEFLLVSHIIYIYIYRLFDINKRRVNGCGHYLYSQGDGL